MATLCVATAIAGILAAISGTGGGSLFIPIFSLAFPRDVHRAVPLSKVAVFGVASGACLTNAASTGSMINFRLATLIQPATLLGCIFGVFLNLLLPSWCIAASLIGVLSYAAYKTYKNAWVQKEKLLASKQAAASPEAPLEDLSPTSTAAPSDKDALQTSSSPSLQPCSTSRAALQTSEALENSNSYLLMLNGVPPVEEEEATPLIAPHSISSARVPQKWPIEMLLLTIDWIVNALCLLLSGGPAALVCGAWHQQIWLYALICFHLLFMTFIARRLMRLRDAVQMRYLFPVEELQWVNPKRMMTYCFLAGIAGVCAGLLGIGGGLIKSPLLIAIGLIPISAVATSNYMIMFTSSTNVLAFVLAGRLSLTHSAMYGLTSLLGGVCGVLTLRKYFAQGSRQFILTFVLASSIVVGMLAMLAVNLRTELSNYLNPSLAADGGELTFSQACQFLETENDVWKRLQVITGI